MKTKISTKVKSIHPLVTADSRNEQQRSQELDISTPSGNITEEDELPQICLIVEAGHTLWRSRIDILPRFGQIWKAVGHKLHNHRILSLKTRAKLPSLTNYSIRSHVASQAPLPHLPSPRRLSTMLLLHFAPYKALTFSQDPARGKEKKEITSIVPHALALNLGSTL